MYTNVQHKLYKHPVTDRVCDVHNKLYIVRDLTLAILQGIVYAVGLLNFPEVEGLWQSFWQCIGQTAQAYKLKLKREYKKREDPSYDILKSTEDENV